MRRTIAILPAFGGALAAAAPSAASYGNGGVTPLNAGTPGAAGIEHAYYLIAGITLAIFLLVEGLLVAFIVRYRRRRRPRTEEGAQIHGATKLELLWTVVPVVLLATVVTFVLVTLPSIQNVPPASAAGGRLDITVEGHQFYWLFRYPNGAISIDRMVAPIDTNVDLTVVSPDVNHSWWVPALGGKIDAIPGRVNHTWFRAPHVGTYFGQCAELCGVQHAAMTAEVDVVSRAAYSSFVSRRRRQLAAASPTLGKEIFRGVCEKCHRLSGPAFIGPSLGGSPLLTDRASITDIVHNGRRQMPAVGIGWSKQEIAALVAYAKTLNAGGASGG